MKKYIPTMTVASDAADLQSLTISAGRLMPAFAGDVTCYNTIVGNDVSSITLTPTLVDADAVVTVDGTEVTSGDESTPIALDVGANDITLAVYSYRGVLLKETALTVHRLTADSQLLLPAAADTCIDSDEYNLGGGDWEGNHLTWVGFDKGDGWESRYVAAIKFDFSWLTEGTISGAGLGITIPDGGTAGAPQADIFSSTDDSWTEKPSSLTLTKGTQLVTDQAIYGAGTITFAAAGIFEAVTDSLDKVVTFIVDDDQADTASEPCFFCFHSDEAADDGPVLVLSYAPDITAPSFAPGYPTTANTGVSAFDLNVQVDESGTAYYVVLADGAAAPDADHVKAGCIQSDRVHRCRRPLVPRRGQRPGLTACGKRLCRRAEPVRLACQYGIVAGYADGTFRPDSLITREEAMTMLYRAMPITEVSVVAGGSGIEFRDGQLISDWSHDAVQACVRTGLVTGSDGYLRPGASITRAETATMLRRLLQLAQLID